MYQIHMKIMIQTIHIRKEYGKKTVLKDINLHISEGMFGLLGKNGAGKTTLMKIMTTLVQPSNGNCYIDGISVSEKKKVRKIIGYIPQEFLFFPDFTCYEMLDYFMLLDNKKDKRKRKAQILEVLDKVHLSDQKFVKIKNLSGGMKRRVGVAQALLTDPKVIVADEPTVGLDPQERMHLRKLLKELSKECVVVLSTHIISDIEDCCDQIGVLQRGNLLFQGTADQLKKQTHTENGTLEEAYLCVTEE